MSTSTDTASKREGRILAMERKAMEHDRDRLIELLEREIAAARAREQAALERAERLEQAAHEREILQLRVFEQAQKQLERARERFEQAQKQLEMTSESLEQIEQQRRIEASPSPAERPAGWQHLRRQRILTLLEERPEGLTRQEIESSLRTNKHLGNTLVGMARVGGPLVRTRKGCYALAKRKDTTQA